MQHLEPDELALAALGEPLTDEAAAHLLVCPSCAEERAAFAAAVSAGRSGGPVEELVEPPARVWQAVAAELGLAPGVRPGASATEAAVPSEVVPSGADGGSPAAGARVPRPASGVPASRSARRSRGSTPRRWPALWLVSAAAAGVVVGGAGVAWWQGRAPAVTVLESAALGALPEWPDASGQAVVEVADDGTRTLVVDLAGAGGADGFHEVWLIDTDVTKLISVGVLHGEQGRFVLPDSLDLAEFPVVDVSEEPYDGDPTHSGDSIVRGTLNA